MKEHQLEQTGSQRATLHRRCIPLAAFTLLGCSAGMAQTQGLPQSEQPSSVTIYGLMDVGVTHLSNVGGSSITQVDSGIGTTSRLGFRGQENLGGGLTAVFQLESGINADNGTNKTPFWTRGSFVGLRSADLGTVTLGRQYDFLYTSLPPDSVPLIQGGLAAGYQGFSSNRPGPPPAVDIHFGGQLYDNTIKYERIIGPWAGGVMYGLGTENNHDHVASLYAKYADPTFQIGAGWVKDNFTTAVFANEVFAVKGFYRFGPWQLMSSLAYGKETVFPGSRAKIKPFELALNYDFTSAFSAGAGIGYAKATNRAGVDSTITQPFVGTRYRLSKRTELYAMAARNHSSNISAVPASVNAPGGAAAASSDGSQSAFRMGITHRF